MITPSLRRNTTLKDTFCAAAQDHGTFPLQNLSSRMMPRSSAIHLWQSSAAVRVFISTHTSIRLRRSRRLASVLTYTECKPSGDDDFMVHLAAAVVIDIETAPNRLISADNRIVASYHRDGRSASVSASLVVENMAVGYRWLAWWWTENRRWLMMWNIQQIV